jgi:hypothetical protein
MTNEKMYAGMDYFKKMRVPYCITNSTLLSLYRDGEPFEDTWFEHEVTLLTAIKYRDKIISYPNQDFYNISPTITGKGNLGVNRLGTKVATMFYTEKNNRMVINVDRDSFWVYDKEVILPYKYMDYHKRKIPIPHDPERLLTEYYGNWRVKQPVWHWADAPNVIHAQSIEEAVKKYESKSTVLS